jgi:hypothetical protein
MKVGDLVKYGFFQSRGLGIIVAIDERHIHPVEVFWLTSGDSAVYPFGDLEVFNEDR